MKKNPETVPTTKGVYCFIEDGEVIYVGRSVNLKARIQTHAFTNYEETNIVLVELESKLESIKLEYFLIDNYDPKYNAQYPTLPAKDSSDLPSDIVDIVKELGLTEKLKSKTWFSDIVKEAEAATA